MNLSDLMSKKKAPGDSTPAIAPDAKAGLMLAVQQPPLPRPTGPAHKPDITPAPDNVPEDIFPKASPPPPPPTPAPPPPPTPVPIPAPVSSAPVPAPVEDESVAAIVTPESAPTTATAGSLFDERPVGMYELAAEMGIDIPTSKDTILKNAAACLGTVFRKIADDRLDKSMLWSTTKSIASDIEGLIGADANVVTELQRPRTDRDRLIWHSLYTSILAMELAHSAPDLPCTVQEIGAAALLHDIGILVLPEFFSSMNQENSPVYQEHVAKGVELALEISAPTDVITMIAQHHEKMDGSGFPHQISGEDVLITSQIIAISNIFEQAQINLMASFEENASPVLVDIPMLFKQYRKAFNNDLLKKMIHIIGFYPVGTVVELNNRSICAVTRQNPDFPLRPVVKVIMDGSGNHPDGEKVIDLRKVAMLSITRSIRRSDGKNSS